MSEKRWYYTDPLEAAWMTRRYGMEYDKEMVPTHMSINDKGDLSLGGTYRNYIHTDSLHLLEPKDGDIVGGIDSDGFTAAVVSVRQGMLGIETNIVWAGSEEYRRYRGEEIIQRDGKPFFWPESEAI